MTDEDVTEADVQWHVWAGEYPEGHDLAGAALTIVVGPTKLGPEAARQRPAAIFMAQGAQLPYCASFNHKPEDYEIDRNLA